MKTTLTIIQPDGTTTTETAEERPDEVPLERLQGLVGGYIELLPPPVSKTAYVNEEGRLQAMDPNFAAMEALGWPTDRPGHWLVGPVVILEKVVSDGA